MEMKILSIIVVSTVLAVCEGEQLSNYEISRNRLYGAGTQRTLFNDIINFIVGGTGGGYNQYPGYGQYPGNYPGGYNPGVAGPPGAHPGCPLCDSSVYSYCSYKQSHDACCCNNGGGFFSFNNCRRQDCSFIYANTCEEYNLISSCCCVDVNLKSAVQVPVAVPAITG